MSFLTAEWRNLLMINYEIAPELLHDYIPKGTELDFYNGKCFVSLVGFMFENTKLLSFRIPFHQDFEEVNLRFYVKFGDKRGVVFIKELVPKKALTFIANTIYKEHYETCPMRHEHVYFTDSLRVNYEWKKNQIWNQIRVISESKAIEIPENSKMEFIAEHYWGYTRISEKISSEYEVTHPKCLHYPVKEYSIKVDFEENYGKNFSFLKTLKPSSVFLAEGSPITVEKNRRI